ncbi:DUF6452 family protein [Maribacter sp.]|uniref:DUF6452 family protein n=1 Tax=Maribacter sp. TaxID=1897614 RepID=UPI0025C6FC37|nr:DUF6452 family protein [Maribacter sp.]
MVKLRVLGVLLVGLISFLACEKDDICVDGDTPLLVIEFYDTNDSTTLKVVPKLRVIGLGKDITAIDKDRTDLNTISIPLKITETSTSFSLIKNSADTSDTDNTDTGNIDTLTFTYELSDEYVSRACGFIANYNGITAALTTDSDNWIKGIEFIATDINLENINTTHVKIYH